MTLQLIVNSKSMSLLPTGGLTVAAASSSSSAILLESLAGVESGSVLSELSTCAKLVIGAVMLATVTLIVKVSLLPLATVPIVQSPVLLLYEPVLAVELLKVKPLGKRSSTLTLPASAGPLLVRVKV